MTDPVATSSDSELRTHVGRVLEPHYALDCEIGRGGMGVVYRAKDRRLKRTVAIKVLPPELAFRSDIKTRFLREAETAAQLNHPNIVDIYAVEEMENIVFFVMAYITGDNLAKRLHEHGTLSVDETRRTLRDVADALAYAHERGVVHRDIKPDNILIDAQSGRPMVTDFGIARAVSDGDSRLTATGIAIGTPAYMSPEQAAGDRSIDGRSDLYSLGILGYQMLTSEPPFVANSTPAMLVKHISERPIPVAQRRADVPPDLANVIMTLLEKDPAERFPSATAVVEALDTGRMPRVEHATSPILADNPAPAATGLAQAPSGAYRDVDLYPAAPPTSEELRRWDAPPVANFRRKLAPYLFVNGVIVIASLVGSSDLFGVSVIWSIYLAFKYAKLWADGYDWRDVFRQPRHRDLIDVADDFLTYLRAVTNRDERKAMREQRRARLGRGGASSRTLAPQTSGSEAHDALRAAGPYGDRIRRAEADRTEILRLLDRMPASERSRIPDVARSADKLAETVRQLAVSLANLDDGGENNSGGESVEAEIARLENAANPLDEVGSDERVHRLTHLKRQRRSLVVNESRRDAIAVKLETCLVALQNVRLDLIRLNAGSQTPQHITSLAMDAMHLADSVDSALYVSDELGRTFGSRSAAR